MDTTTTTTTSTSDSADSIFYGQQQQHKSSIEIPLLQNTSSNNSNNNNDVCNNMFYAAQNGIGSYCYSTDQSTTSSTTTPTNYSNFFPGYTPYTITPQFEFNNIFYPFLAGMDVSNLLELILLNLYRILVFLLEFFENMSVFFSR